MLCPRHPGRRPSAGFAAVDPPMSAQPSGSSRIGNHQRRRDPRVAGRQNSGGIVGSSPGGRPGGVEGLPVISARNSSLPEVLSDAAERIDGYEVDEWPQRIQSVLGDSDCLAQLRAAGFERIKNSSGPRPPARPGISTAYSPDPHRAQPRQIPKIF